MFCLLSFIFNHSFHLAQISSSSAWKMLISPLPTGAFPTLLSKWIIGSFTTLSFSCSIHPLGMSTTYIWGCSCERRLIKARTEPWLISELLEKEGRLGVVRVCMCVCYFPPLLFHWAAEQDLSCAPLRVCFKRWGVIGVRGTYEKERLRRVFSSSYRQPHSFDSSSVHSNMPRLI